MYIPKHFEVTDQEEALAFIMTNGFGQLVSTIENRLFVSHLPFLVSENGKSIICHLAKNNPQWKSIEEQEVLVTFQGPHDYISPSWYSSPGVPTWNYQSVHIYGKPVLVTEPKKLCSIVGELTKKYESSFEKPWNPEYKESLLNMIIGIEIQITDIQCKYKLSQNRPESDQKQVAEQLKQKGSIELAKAMKIEL